MPRVDVILDMDLEYLMDNPKNRIDVKTKRGKEKTIKIDEETFKIALEEGLIEKTDHGYVFIGKSEDIAALKKQKN